MNKIRKDALEKKITDDKELLDTEDDESEKPRREVTGDQFDQTMVKKLFDDHFDSSKSRMALQDKIKMTEKVQHGIIYWNAQELLYKTQLYENTLILLGQKNCPHSDHALKVFEHLWKEKRSWLNNNNVNLAYCEAADEMKKLKGRFEIDGYPTIVFLTQQSTFKLRNEEAVNVKMLLDFMTHKFNFKIEELLKWDQLKNNYFKRSDRVVVYYGDKSHPRYKLYKEIAHDNDSVPFLYTNAPNIQWKLKLKKNSISVLGVESIIMNYDDMWKKDKLTYWIYTRTKPLFIVPTKDEEEYWMDATDSPLVYVFLGSENSNTSMEIYHILKLNRNLYSKHFHTIMCYEGNQICTRLAKRHKFVDYDKLPTIKVEKGKKENRLTFGYSGLITDMKFRAFMAAVLENKLKPEFLTEKMPSTHILDQKQIVKKYSWRDLERIFQLDHDKVILFYNSDDPRSVEVRKNFHTVAKKTRNLKWHH